MCTRPDERRDGRPTARLHRGRRADRPAHRRAAIRPRHLDYPQEEQYTVQVIGPLAERASGALGLPFEGDSGGYRLDPLADYDRQLLRGLAEGCGTVCFKSGEGGSSDAVGLSFVHESKGLLRTVQSLLDDIPAAAPYGELSEASSGYWFGVDDDAVPAVGEWLYEGSDATGLFAPSRRRKLRKSLERVR